MGRGLDLATTTDEDLMLAFAQGDARAFEVLYDRHRASLFRYIHRFVNDTGLAEELYQDVWTRLIDTRMRYRVEARFQTFLYRVAHNRVMDHFRRKKPDTSVDEPDFPEPRSRQQDAPDRAVQSEAVGWAIQQAVAQLPIEQRTAFILQSDSGLSLEQIAEVCGVGRETIKSRLRYAMNKLRQTLEGHYENAV